MNTVVTTEACAIGKKLDGQQLFQQSGTTGCQCVIHLCAKVINVATTTAATTTLHELE